MRCLGHGLVVRARLVRLVPPVRRVLVLPVRQVLGPLVRLRLDLVAVMVGGLWRMRATMKSIYGSM